MCRFGQGLGLGGEWGGAVLLAIENAPPGRRAWYGMFPQLGAPVGFVCSACIFLLLSAQLTDEQFFSYGWRIPFLASAALVVGRPVRAARDPRDAGVPRGARAPRARQAADGASCSGTTPKPLVLGTMMALATFVLFYLMTVFALSWGTTALGYTRQQFLLIQLFGIVFFALTIPLSAVLADRYGRRRTLLVDHGGDRRVRLRPRAWPHRRGTAGAMFTMALGLALMGFTYGPLGTALSELFPTSVRYTGSSLTFNLAGIFGASLAPYAATYLAQDLRTALRRLLPDAGRGADDDRSARLARDQRRRPDADRVTRTNIPFIDGWFVASRSSRS